MHTFGEQGDLRVNSLVICLWILSDRRGFSSGDDCGGCVWKAFVPCELS